MTLLQIKPLTECTTTTDGRQHFALNTCALSSGSVELHPLPVYRVSWRILGQFYPCLKANPGTLYDLRTSLLSYSTFYTYANEKSLLCTQRIYHNRICTTVTRQSHFTTDGQSVRLGIASLLGLTSRYWSVYCNSTVCLRAPCLTRVPDCPLSQVIVFVSRAYLHIYIHSVGLHTHLQYLKLCTVYYIYMASVSVSLHDYGFTLLIIYASKWKC